ncbi:type I restriction-modification system DNA methylase subunit [Mycoplasmopsis mustelae]|uniref:site-specific DNA-methyltransferase (adenine-specific) n=1 Tax=Mycoplasmopsis mustelae TaxID=171289 RepID=A0A4R7UBW5_9BACT|nr:N-6 DNA methylase [Mycoplasmopsis mustelae]TDV23031.1 type I restriction-modification system DNA methylase subunit [Mycoplasmopsis mustelae]
MPKIRRQNDSKKYTIKEKQDILWNAIVENLNKREILLYKQIILSIVFFHFLSKKLLLNYFWEAKPELNQLPEIKINEKYENEAIFQNIEKYQSMKDKLFEKLGFFIPYNNLINSKIKNNETFIYDSKWLKKVFQDFTEIINTSENPSKETYKYVFDSAIFWLNTTNTSMDKKINILINIINNPNLNITLNEYQDVFENLLYKFSSLNKQQLYIPKSIDDLMSGLLLDSLDKKTTKISIYNQNFNNLAWLVSFDKKTEDSFKKDLYIQTTNAKIFELTKINALMLENQNSNYQWLKREPLQQLFQINNKIFSVDVVMNCANSNIKLSKNEFSNDIRFNQYDLPKTSEYAYLLNALFYLKENGVMFSLISQKTLFAEKTNNEKLIQQGFIDKIIQLPEGIFNNKNENYFLLQIKKTSSKNKKIQFIDASKLFTIKDEKKVLEIGNIKRILDIAKSETFIENYSKIVSLNEIISNNYSLNFSDYFKDNANVTKPPKDLVPARNWIPIEKINELEYYLCFRDGIKEQLFKPVNDWYFKFKNIETAREIIDELTYGNMVYSLSKMFDSFENYFRELYDFFDKPKIHSNLTKFVGINDYEERIWKIILKNEDKFTFYFDKYHFYQEFLNYSADFRNKIEKLDNLLRVKKDLKTVVLDTLIKIYNSSKSNWIDKWDSEIIDKEELEEYYDRLVSEESQIISKLLDVDIELDKYYKSIEPENQTEKFFNKNKKWNKTKIHEFYLASKYKKEKTEFEKLIIQVAKLLIKSRELYNDYKFIRMNLELRTYDNINFWENVDFKEFIVESLITMIHDVMNHIEFYVTLEFKTKLEKLLQEYNDN